MHVQQRDTEAENGSKEILKTIGYVVSLKKIYFKTRDLTNMLGVKPEGRHKLSRSLRSLLNRNLIEIYHKNSRNLYRIPVEKTLVDAYYKVLWNHFQT
jgi:hypothetical protein